MTELARQISMHERYYELLLEIVRQDHYSSATMLNMLEADMLGYEREELVDVLLDKVADDRFPSISMLRRIQRIAAL